jgi:DNA-damage-inducible protein D
MPLLGYSQWRRFEDSIDRAKAACQNSGNQAFNHLTGAGKMIPTGKGAVREFTDVHMSRFGAYLIAVNGDPRKPEIAAAQRDFAVQARRAELELPAPVIVTAPPPLIRPWGKRNSWCAA